LDANQPDEQAGLPRHKLHHFQPGEGLTHGFYARSRPPQAIEDMLRQDIQGIDDEFAWLRILGRGLIERQGQARSSQEMASLGEAYTLLAYRMGEMVKAERALEEGGDENREVEEYMDRWEKFAEACGDPFPQGWRDDILYGGAELAEASRQLAEEVAGLRCVIRNAFRLAMQTQETRAYIHLVDVYGTASVRLVKLLRSGGGAYERVLAYFRQALDIVLEELTEEWHLRE
jgi:hypothetical protein